MPSPAGKPNVSGGFFFVGGLPIAGSFTATRHSFVVPLLNGWLNLDGVAHRRPPVSDAAAQTCNDEPNRESL
jgi:hypothetical protein